MYNQLKIQYDIHTIYVICDRGVNVRSPEGFTSHICHQSRPLKSEEPEYVHRTCRTYIYMFPKHSRHDITIPLHLVRDK